MFLEFLEGMARGRVVVGDVDEGEEEDVGSTWSVALFEAEGEELELTGLSWQRLTCLFRLDATPNLRPQVSHTYARRERMTTEVNEVAHDPHR